MRVRDLKEWDRLKYNWNIYTFIKMWTNNHWIFNLQWKPVIMFTSWMNVDKYILNSNQNNEQRTNKNV